MHAATLLSARDKRIVGRSGRGRGGGCPRPTASPPPRTVAELAAHHVEHRDLASRDALFEEFLPLAHKLARRYVRTSEASEDLTQVASLGLLKAIDRFDPARGARFASFAVPTILGELRRYFRDATWAVHVPRRAQERLQSVEAATARLTALHRRSPTVQQIAAELDWTVDDVLDGLLARRAYDAEPLEAREGDEDGALTVLEVVGVEDDGFASAEEHATVAPVLATLPRRERRVLYLSFVEEMTQAQIAKRIGVSQMQVSRILAGTIERVRERVDAG